MMLSDGDMFYAPARWGRARRERKLIVLTEEIERQREKEKEKECLSVSSSSIMTWERTRRELSCENSPARLFREHLKQWHAYRCASLSFFTSDPLPVSIYRPRFELVIIDQHAPPHCHSIVFIWLGAIFDNGDGLSRRAFEYAVAKINAQSQILPRSKIVVNKIDLVDAHDSFSAYKMGKVLSNGD